MCDANHEQIYNLCQVLRCFEVILGLKVNLRKSNLVAEREVPH